MQQLGRVMGPKDRAKGADEAATGSALGPANRHRRRLWQVTMPPLGTTTSCTREGAGAVRFGKRLATASRYCLCLYWA